LLTPGKKGQRPVLRPRYAVHDFVVRDREGQQLAYVHFDNPRAAARPAHPRRSQTHRC